MATIKEIAQIVGGTDRNIDTEQSSMDIRSSIPIMAVFMALQKFIQNRLVAGGVKG